MDDLKTQTAAVKYVKENKNEIISRFASLKEFPSEKFPFTILMAGSPGAGKTEFSLTLIKELYQKNPDSKIVRVDADEIKESIPFYNGKNSYTVQGAAIIAMEKIIDHAYHNNQSALIDGTFAHYDSSVKNIERSVKYGRPVKIWYLYLDPRIAWDYTRKREVLEGRPIKKEDFINAFFLAKENVNKAKRQFGKTVDLNLVIKDFSNSQNNKLQLNVENIDNYITIGYNAEQLNKILI